MVSSMETFTTTGDSEGDFLPLKWKQVAPNVALSVVPNRDFNASIGSQIQTFSAETYRERHRERFMQSYNDQRIPKEFYSLYHLGICMDFPVQWANVGEESSSAPDQNIVTRLQVAQTLRARREYRNVITNETRQLIWPLCCYVACHPLLDFALHYLTTDFFKQKLADFREARLCMHCHNRYTDGFECPECTETLRVPCGDPTTEFADIPRLDAPLGERSSGFVHILSECGAAWNAIVTFLLTVPPAAAARHFDEPTSIRCLRCRMGAGSPCSFCGSGKTVSAVSNTTPEANVDQHAERLKKLANMLLHDNVRRHKRFAIHITDIHGDSQPETGARGDKQARPETGARGDKQARPETGARGGKQGQDDKQGQDNTQGRSRDHKKSLFLAGFMME